ncbi:MAG: hypothetical protein V4543_12085 [Bacteroidota bacterium]
MLGFFRINVPDRLIALLVIMLMARVPFLLFGAPVTMPELVWQLCGEKLSHGALLYRDLVTELGPLPAYIYALLYAVFGKATLPLQILAMALTLLQAMHLNRIAIRYDLFPERTWVPAAVYIFLSGWFFQFITLSPALISSTFLVAAFGKTVKMLKAGLREEEFLLPGFYTALAALCWQPSALFMPVPVIVFLLYTGVKLRQYFLLAFGFVLPFLVPILAFYTAGDATDFYRNYLPDFFNGSRTNYLGISTLLSLFSIPLVFLVFAVFKLSKVPRITNFQQNSLSVAFFWLLSAIGGAVFSSEGSANPFYTAIAPMSIFICWLFLLQKRNPLTELWFMLLLLAGVFCLYVTPFVDLHAGPQFEQVFSIKNLVVKPPSANFPTGKKILVLGDDLSLYQGNRLATPYLSRRLAQADFGRMDEYEGVRRIYSNISSDYPDYIVNLDGTLDSLFNRIPVLASQYRPDPASGKGVYVHVGN